MICSESAGTSILAGGSKSCNTGTKDLACGIRYLLCCGLSFPSARHFEQRFVIERWGFGGFNVFFAMNSTAPARQRCIRMFSSPCAGDKDI